jgi:hypothetical protein
VGKWKELENMSSKISQTQKDKYHVFFYIRNPDFF